MRCFPDPDRNPFHGVPKPLMGRRADELNHMGETEYGVKLTGGDPISVSAELSGTTIPRFLEWCGVMGIVRCDVDRVSDLTAFLGRSPLTLGVIDEWKSNPAMRDALTSLTPDELWTVLDSVSADVLSAGNRHIDDLRAEASRGNEFAARDLQANEQLAQMKLREAGFAVPDRDDDPLGPPPPRELNGAERVILSDLWGNLSGYDDAPTKDPFRDL